MGDGWVQKCQGGKEGKMESWPSGEGGYSWQPWVLVTTALLHWVDEGRTLEDLSVAQDPVVGKAIFGILGGPPSIPFLAISSLCKFSQPFISGSRIVVSP